jgi:hypothetical protein
MVEPTHSFIRRTDGPVALPDSQFAIRLHELTDPQLQLFATSPDVPYQPTVGEAVGWLREYWRRKICGGVDSFAYTKKFDDLYEEFSAVHARVLPALRMSTRAESRKSALWLTLLNMRKSGLLSTFGRRADAALTPASAQEVRIARLYIALPQSRSERERLPYTNLFDDLFARFVRECRRNGVMSSMTNHEFWRVIVRIMKSERRKEVPQLFPSPTCYPM